MAWPARRCASSVASADRNWRQSATYGLLADEQVCRSAKKGGMADCPLLVVLATSGHLDGLGIYVVISQRPTAGGAAATVCARALVVRLDWRSRPERRLQPG